MSLLSAMLYGNDGIPKEYLFGYTELSLRKWDQARPGIREGFTCIMCDLILAGGPELNL